MPKKCFYSKLTFSLLLLSLLACKQKETTLPFNKLLGHWADTAAGMGEKWELKNDTWIGYGFDLDSSNTMQNAEKLCIFKNGGTWIYKAMPTVKYTALFAIDSMGEWGFSAHRDTNDFPTKIVYLLQGKTNQVMLFKDNKTVKLNFTKQD